MNDLPIKVLLIDDDEEDYILTRYVFDEFKHNQFELEWIDNYTDGLAALKECRHDIFLLDYRLGEKNGLELLGEAIESGCRAPIILLTGQGDKEIDFQAMQAGAADYLVKSELEPPLLERSIRYSLEHAKTLQKFRESEARYRNLVETLPVMFYAVEPKPPYAPVYLSPSFENFGYPLKKWHDSPDMWMQILHTDDREWVLNKIETAITEDSETNYEYRLIAADNTVRWVHDRGRFYKDENNNIVFWQGIIIDITERKQAEKSLSENEERYSNLFENTNDIVYVHDLEGNYLSVNKAAERIFGYKREEILKMNISQVLVPDDLEISKRKLTGKIEGIKNSIHEVRGLSKDRKHIPLEVSSCGIYEDGELVAVQGIARDITERKRTEEALRESEERFRDLVENANDLIYTHDLQGHFTSLNRAGEITTGYLREEALRMNISQIVAPEYVQMVQKMTQRKMQGAPPTSYELEIISKSGKRVTLEINTRWIFKDEQPAGVQGIARDITERKLAEEQLQYNALYDTLTDLPNRTHFMKQLTLAVERSELEKRFRFAVLFLDIDRFKIINDSLGHIIGDKLLVGIAERLKSCVRPSDVISRLGGDEFTILLTIKEELDAIQIAERLQQKLSKPFKLDNYEVFTSASIGIIISDDVRRKPEDYLRDADTAMYRAKETGKARYEIFDSKMHLRNMNLLKVETDLRRAIERSEFRAYYQPIIALGTGEILEFESLIRWEHPEKGMISPYDFISIAEETGLIIPIGRWILEESCRQLKEWQNMDFPHQMSVSVNLSAKQLMHPSLISQVQEILQKTELDPQFLKLEVTESTVMENSETALRVLSQLRELGVRLSTDDFGTGFSSLSYLHRFPFDRLKIDRSFINKMDEDTKSGEIVRTILMLAQNLNIETVAEGIETRRQLSQLQELGCNFGQGFLFSKPVAAPEAEKLIKEGLPPEAKLSYIAADINRDGFIEINKVQ
ncbi:hypothetical protein BH20ACI4_BH20ACI4_12390 [soil metagenome]